MYVRIATFENAAGDWDERLEEVRKRMSGEVDSPMAGARPRRDCFAVDKHHRSLDRVTAPRSAAWSS